MKKRYSFRKMMALTLAWLMLLTSVPLSGISFNLPSFADVTVGTTKGTSPLPITVSHVDFVKINNGFTPAGGYLQIWGTNLTGVSVMFNTNVTPLTPKGGFTANIGTRVPDMETLVRYDFTADEMNALEGHIQIGNKSISLQTGSFPAINGINTKNIYYQNNQIVGRTPQNLVISGNNLDSIDGTSVTATYGISSSTHSFTYSGSDPTHITIIKPTPPDTTHLGYQTLKVDKTIPENGNNPEIHVGNEYSNAFRFLDDINLTHLQMYPNTGAKDEQVFFTASGFTGITNYAVFFLKALDPTDDFSDVNKANSVSTIVDANNNGQIIAKVPNNPKFDLGDYKVVIARTDGNGNVIASQTVTNQDGVTPSIFTVVQSSSPVPGNLIVTPNAGPDSGDDAQITGKNILYPGLVGLTRSNPATNLGETYTLPTPDAKSLHVDYKDDYVYQTSSSSAASAVTVSRDVTVMIGKRVIFNPILDASNNPVLDPISGAPLARAAKGSNVGGDTLYIHTDVIDDAAVSPSKDVVVDVTTRLTDKANPTKVYVFHQVGTLTNGYTFIPGTLKPTVSKVSPPMIPVTSLGNDYKLNNPTYLSVEGSNFLVDQYTDAGGSSITRYPSVLIKKNRDNTDPTVYQLAFLPNEAGTPKGIIQYRNSLGQLVPLKDAGGQSIPVDVTVLNSSGTIVNGVGNNTIGNRILIKIPDGTMIGDIGTMSVQVINPYHKRAGYGGTSVLNDSLTFVEIGDAPAISSVDPLILTTDGGQDVHVTGKNFQSGLRIFLDGIEITTFTKVKAPGASGDDLITFKSPKGREGNTQLLLLNPSGGTAVRALTYVKVLQNAPTITNFTPTQGTPGTLVVVNGTNFQTPDPTATGMTGVDANRLIGTHVLFDGMDVNDYSKDVDGAIVFKPYTSPGKEPLIKDLYGKAAYSSFKDNTMVTTVVSPSPVGTTATLVTLGYDSVGHPMLTDTSGKSYIIQEISAGVFKTPDGTSVNITNDTITVGSQVFNVTMNNNVVFASQNVDGTTTAKTANYVNSIILQNNTTKAFYTLATDLKGNVVLSNGKDDIYTITQTVAGFQAVKNNGAPLLVTVDSSKLTVGTVDFTFKTPFKVDEASGNNNEIIGNRTKVLSDKQIIFTVPKNRDYADGYYDVTVSNPDTKSDSKTGQNGFKVVRSAPNPPVIASIVPNKGSVDGGYIVTINGSSFDTKTAVYIDSVLVPLSDTFVGLDGKTIKIKMPKCTKDLQKDFKINSLSVPVVVVNGNSSTAALEKGFIYVKPASNPVITVSPPTTGSSNGGQIVIIKGDDIRFFEPYDDVNFNGVYDANVDKLIDLNGNGTYDSILPFSTNAKALQVTDPTVPIYGYYLKSPILPKIYFGEQEGKVVEYNDGYIKVITPPHAKGIVDLFLVNNDYGVSNKVQYTYTSSSPKITNMVPNNGRRTGQEMKDIYGAQFFPTSIRGYYSEANATQGTLDPNSDSTIVAIPDKDKSGKLGVNALVRFGNIDNLSKGVSDANSGQINSQRASVSLEGGLMVEYTTAVTTGSALEVPAIKMTVTENNTMFTRTFYNYDNSTVYLPMEMLTNTKDGTFYRPFNFTDADGVAYKNNVYEYIKVSVVDGMLKVERGYAPKTSYDNAGHIMVMTPSYYSVDTVNATVYNNDGGMASTNFTYTNPASAPKIYVVNAYKPSADGTYLMVEGAVNGKIQIEILGQDLRKDAAVTINGKATTLVEQTTRVVGTTTYDVLIVQVPTGTISDVDLKYPIVVQNTDGGLASSATLGNLIPNNYTKPDGTQTTMPFFFLYRKALSGPKINTISPSVTSVYGGNTITLTGSDFRVGSTIVIGSRGGVPVAPSYVDPKGTTLTFITPKNLTLGAKDIQVINSDFGTDTKTGGLTIISYPQTTAMYNANHNSISRLSTEGGETITIVGSGFVNGAKVIFGGTSTITGDAIGGSIGLWKNDTHYLMKDGVEGANVTVLDSGALTVKTPAIKTEGPIVITVINPDSGMSDGNLSTEYRLPIPTDVTSLSVKVVDNKYIQLYNYTSTNLDYYEVYYYIGQLTEQTLKGTDNYQDFKLLEVTDREPYKILDLPGYENKKSKDYVWFVVKAVNKYGASNYSNLAYLTNSDVKDLVKIGAPDLDGPAGVPLGKEYLAYIKDNALSVDLSNTPGNVSMTLTSIGGDKYPVRQINFPASRVIGDGGTVQVDYGDVLIKIAPVTLNTGEFSTLNQSDKAYGQITTSIQNNSYTSSMKQDVPRSQRVVSPLYQLEFAALNNKSKAVVQQLKGPMVMQFDYGRYAMTAVEESKLGIYKYNTSSGQWQKVRSSQNKTLHQISAQVKDSGTYMMLTNR